MKTWTHLIPLTSFRTCKAGKPGLLKSLLTLFVLSILLLSSKTFGQIGAGVAPVTPPVGQFNIDGTLHVNGAIGDWLPGPGGGGNVLDAAGNPLVPGTTFHFIDPWNDPMDNNFHSGLKFDDDPNDWTRVFNPVNSKEDMNNGLIHFAKDGNGHTWVIVAADRRTDNGDAYVDFEFLQKSLTINSGGQFVSAGTDGGRTVNDFVLTLELTGGGSTATFFVDRWEANGSGGFDYFDRTSALPIGSTYAAVNTADGTPVSFSAFGNNTYDQNTFVEGAVDLTALIHNFNPCEEFGVNSILIKTKESQSPSATIVDFINPLNDVDITLGVADAGKDQAKCSEGDATTFTIVGEALPDQTVNFYWEVFDGTATIDDPNSLTTDVHVSSATATIRLVVETISGCSPAVHDDVVLTVNAPPVVSAGSYGPACIDASVITLTGSPAGGSFSGDGVSGDTFDPAAAGIGSHTVTYAYTDNATGCSNSAATDIVVNDKPEVTITPQAALCIDASAITLTGSPSGGTFSGDGVSGDSFDPAAAGTGTHTIIYTYTDGNTCSNSASTDIVVNGKPEVTITPQGPICVNASAITLTGSPSGGTFSGDGVTGDSFDPAAAGTGAHTITYFYSDGNTCSNSASTSITVNAAPTLVVTSPSSVCAPSTVNLTSAAVTAGSSAGTLTYWTNAAATSALANPSAVSASGTYYIKLTNSNGCFVIKPVTVTVNICSGIYPTSTSCAGFNSGTIQFLPQVCVSTKRSKTGTTVSGATPGVFFYYTKITAPAATFDVYIDQTKCSSLSLAVSANSNQVLAWTNSCTKLAAGTIVAGGDATIHITKATAGQLVIISVQYNVKSLVGATVSGALPCQDAFVTRLGTTSAAPVIANTSTSITISANCSASALIASSSVAKQTLNASSALSVKAYPNPYTSAVNFSIVSPVSGKAVLEAYNTLGQRVAIIFEGNLDAGMQHNVTYNISAGNRVPLMYKLTVGGQTYHGTIIPAR